MTSDFFCTKITYRSRLGDAERLLRRRSRLGLRLRLQIYEKKMV